MVQRTTIPLRDLQKDLGQQLGDDTDPLELLREMLLHGISRLANDEQHRRVCHIILHRCEMHKEGDVSDTLINAMCEDSREVLVSLCHDISRTHSLFPSLSCEDACDIIMAFMVGSYDCSLRHPAIYCVERNMEAKVDALLNGLFR